MKRENLSFGKTLLGVITLITMLTLPPLVSPAGNCVYAAGYIGKDKAQSIALKDAGYNAKNVSALFCKLDVDDDESEYEIEFIAGGYEYEYTVDAFSGRITEREVERSKYAGTVTTSARKTTTSTTASKPAAAKTSSKKTTTKYITASKAKSIALKNAGFKASKISGYKSNLDKKDSEYEIKFKKSGYRYEYTINAVNGKIKDRSYEKIKVTKSGGKNKISKAKAKSIALGKAGVKKVSKYKIKAKKYRGVSVWEVSFKKGSAEYEYKIDRKTGKVLEFEYDIDD